MTVAEIIARQERNARRDASVRRVWQLLDDLTGIHDPIVVAFYLGSASGRLLGHVVEFGTDDETRALSTLIDSRMIGLKVRAA